MFMLRPMTIFAKYYSNCNAETPVKGYNRSGYTNTDWKPLQ